MNNDRLGLCVSAAVVLAVVVLAGFVVARLASTGPAVIAAVLTTLTGLLAALPPIIRAVRGGNKRS